MVYTRQMTIGSGQGGNESPEHTYTEYGPAKSTRNSIASQMQLQQIQGQGQCNKCAAPQPSTSGMQGQQTPVAAVRQPQPLNFLDLPQEVIEKIFSYLTYKNVCQLRFVCTRFDRICGHILNSTFQRLQHQLLERFHQIKKKMPRRESARRNHHLACESDIIETLHMRLTLLQMSLGKHIERKHCCFFPGEILDEVMHILHYIKVTPKLTRPYKVTDELFDLSTMAMEYFKEKIEPDLPEIAYFSTDFLEFSGSFPSTSTKKYLCLDSYSMDLDETKDVDQQSHDASVDNNPPEATPQSSNIVLRKGIKKIKQGMKKYNSQLTILRQDVRSCRQKAAEQQKLMSEQQKQLAEQQKQILEYASRMDENEKKNEEMSRKFSTVLQELNKCKTELQYWRSKSPATPMPFCTHCGNAVIPPLSSSSSSNYQEELLSEQSQLNSNLLEAEFVPIASGSSASSQQQSGNVAGNMAPVILAPSAISCASAGGINGGATTGSCSNHGHLQPQQQQSTSNNVFNMAAQDDGLTLAPATSSNFDGVVVSALTNPDSMCHSTTTSGNNIASLSLSSSPSSTNMAAVQMTAAVTTGAMTVVGGKTSTKRKFDETLSKSMPETASTSGNNNNNSRKSTQRRLLKGRSSKRFKL